MATIDYISLGAIGFAQIGTENYYAAKVIESKVLEKYSETEQFKIPEKFKHMCSYVVKNFPYENDSYRELVLLYDTEQVQQWEDEYEKKLEDLGIDNWELVTDMSIVPENEKDLFFDFVSEIQLIDLETEELKNQCKKLYAKEFPMHISYQKEVDKKLKAV